MFKDSLTKDHREWQSKETNSSFLHLNMHTDCNKISTIVGAPSSAEIDIKEFTEFVESIILELHESLDHLTPDPCLQMILELLKRHFDAKPTNANLLIEASGVPYGTANRRLKELIDTGLIDRRARTKSGKSYTLHPSEKLLKQLQSASRRIERLIGARNGYSTPVCWDDYCYGASYQKDRAIPPLKVLNQPLRVVGGIKILGHGDPNFMVIESLKRHLEQIIGCGLTLRAFSIDQLYEENLRNAERKRSHFDLVAINYPWFGEFAKKNILLPLDEAMDIAELDPADFHPTSWQACHWEDHCYGIPSQTSAEILYCRKDLFLKHGLKPPINIEELLNAAQTIHDPYHNIHGIAWNAAKGTPLGHSFLMAMADFGQPVVNLPKIAGGFDLTSLAQGDYQVCINSPIGVKAAEYLLELLKYSPPDILSMSWYERVRCYAAGNVAMAYGYTQMVHYIEHEHEFPALTNTDFLPHPSGCLHTPLAPLGGYALGIPNNISRERLPAALQMLALLTSPQAQKTFVLNGSRSTTRDSVGDDSEVRKTSPIFEALDGMSLRDELQAWPRPPIPEINKITQICGLQMHEALRGIVPVHTALALAQEQSEEIVHHYQKQNGG